MVRNVTHLKLWRDAQKVEAQNARDYSAAFNKIQADLQTFYKRSLSYRLGILNNTELARFQKFLVKAKEFASEIKDLELKDKAKKLSNRLTVKREEKLLFDIEYTTAELTETLINDIDVLLINSTDEAFENTVLLVNKAQPVRDVSKVKLARTTANEIKTHEFPGAKFDQFLKDRKTTYYKNIEKTVVRSLRTGTGISSVMKGIRSLTRKQKGHTKTLVRNQMSYVLNLASKEAMKKLNVDQYIYRAILDSKTTEICKSLNGKVFNVEEGVPGVNMPPMSPPIHPCRSFIEPYFGEEE